MAKETNVSILFGPPCIEVKLTNNYVSPFIALKLHVRVLMLIFFVAVWHLRNATLIHSGWIECKEVPAFFRTGVSIPRKFRVPRSSRR